MSSGSSNRKDTWKSFEEIVTRIERYLAPQGAIIKSPDLISDKSTGAAREVDGSIRYKIGSVPVLITLECRDRSRKQDVTWIEQIATKAQSIGASVTIAISSKGFSAEAIKKANQLNVELRTFSDLSDEEISTWAEKIKLESQLLEWQFINIQLRIEDKYLNVEPNLLSNINQDIKEYGYSARIYNQESNSPTLEELGLECIHNGQYPNMPSIEIKSAINFPGGCARLIQSQEGACVFQMLFNIKINRSTQPLPLLSGKVYKNKNHEIIRVAKSEMFTGEKMIPIQIFLKEAEV